MSEWKSRVTTHLRSAQDWLSKAERSFDEQKDIRGELNLMLAQAELKRAQEEKRSAKRLRYRCYRQGGALLCAIVLFGLGSLVWMVGSANDAKQAVTPIQSTAARASHSVATETLSMSETLATEKISSASAVSEEGRLQPLSVSVETPYEEYNEAHRTSSSVVLSKEEVQNLMKAAGRSLRGQ